MNFFDILTLFCLLSSSIFFLGGTIGLLRFPDLYTRIHAPTKADNLGLGLLILGLCFQAESVATVAKLILIWIMALIVSASTGQLIASYGLEKEGKE